MSSRRGARRTWSASGGRRGPRKSRDRTERAFRTDWHVDCVSHSHRLERPTERTTVMADNLKEKLQKAGNKVSEGVEKAGDWVKEKAHEAGDRADEATTK